MATYVRIGYIWLQVLLLILSFTPIKSQTGFLSIDCGSESNYTDPETSITWVTDAGYILTGKNAHNITDSSTDSATSLSSQVQSLRYFDEERNKNCYVLPVKANLPYLVRATIFKGNWTLVANNIIWFDVYINSTLWFTQGYLPGGYDQEAESATSSENVEDNVGGVNVVNLYEGIVYSRGSQLLVCLVKKINSSGSPFISSLELRELASEMYNITQLDKLLKTSRRWNLGATSTDSLEVRYPDDVYDRIWNNPSSWAETTTAKANRSINSWVTSIPNAALDRPPVKVMEQAWVDLSWYTVRSSVFASSDAYVNAYFQEIFDEATGANIRGIDYTLNDVPISSFDISNQPLEISYLIKNITYGDTINLTLYQAPSSNLGSLINAVEMFEVHDIDISITESQDVIVLAEIQSLYRLTDWVGDPCLPVSYDWLYCNQNEDSTFRITQLALANKRLTNGSASPSKIRDLKMLTKLDITNNSLGGNISNLVENLGSLQELHASDNQFNGDFPSMQLFSLQSLSVVYLDRNQYQGALDLSTWYQLVRSNLSFKLHVISLVDNEISGIYPELDADMSKTIERLINNSALPPNSGIFLAGNPWCDPNKWQSLAQQYLCRRNPSDALTITSRPGELNTRTIILATTIPIGAFTILLSSICFVTLRKLRKEMLVTRGIQEALAQQKVQPPFFSYTDIRAATGNFSMDKCLGQGAFGSVYLGVLSNRIVVAVKKLFPSQQVLAEFLNEVVLITGIKHRNLVQLKGCCIDDKQRILVYEYAENGNLDEALHGGVTEFRLDWEKRLHISVGVARGLTYLHEELQPSIIHRDIKPANILLDKNWNAKIGDFGLARSFMEEQSQAAHTQLAGTLGYLAPEYASQGELTEKADVYSFGILLLEIISGRKCIDHNFPEGQVFLQTWARNLQKKGMLLDLLDPNLREDCNYNEVRRVLNVAFLCLQLDPTNRPKMSHVVTMLIGNVDVTSFFNKSIPNEPDFDILMPLPTGSKMLESVRNSEGNLLIDMDFKNTIGLSDGSNPQLIELSNVRAR